MFIVSVIKSNALSKIFRYVMVDKHMVRGRLKDLPTHKNVPQASCKKETNIDLVKESVTLFKYTDIDWILQEI